MDLVDEHDGAFKILDLRDDRLEAFLEIAAITCAGKERAHIQRVYRDVLKHFRDIRFDDPAGEAFRDRGFSNTWITHVKRIVLPSTAQYLDCPVDFCRPADQWIDLAVFCFLIEVYAIRVERFGPLLVDLLAFDFLVCPLDRLAFTEARYFAIP